MTSWKYQLKDWFQIPKKSYKCRSLFLFFHPMWKYLSVFVNYKTTSNSSGPQVCLKVWLPIQRNKKKLLLCPRITEDLPYRSHDHHIVSLFLILGTTSGCLEMRAKRSVVPHLSIPMTWKYGRHFTFPLTEVQQGFLCDELKVNGAWKIKIVLIIF